MVWLLGDRSHAPNTPRGPLTRPAQYIKPRFALVVVRDVHRKRRKQRAVMKTYGRKRSRPNGRRDEALLLSPLLPFPPRASVSTESTTPITPDGLARGTATLAATPSPGERRALKPGTRGCAPGSGSVPTSRMGAGKLAAISKELWELYSSGIERLFSPIILWK